MKALILDDSEGVRMIFSRLLLEAGYQVIACTKASEAQESLAADPSFDFILVDRNMPEMNGLEFIAWVRKNPTYEKIRLILLTTNPDFQEVQLGLEAGADDCIMKPCGRETILQKLEMMGLSNQS